MDHSYQETRETAQPRGSASVWKQVRLDPAIFDTITHCQKSLSWLQAVQSIHQRVSRSGGHSSLAIHEKQ